LQIGQYQEIDRMMNFPAGRRAAVLSSLLLAAGCASIFGGHRTTRELGDRLQAHLAPDIAAGRVALQPLPAGARVTLLDRSMFQNDRGALANQGHDILSSVIEGLVDPRLVRIDVADGSSTPDGAQSVEARSVSRFFQDFGLGPEVQAAEPRMGMPAGSAGVQPGALTISINIQCPRPHGAYGDSSGPAEPSCD